MLSTKYYDQQLSRPINLDRDGCDLNDWSKLYGKALFARHHKGFLVFLPPHELEANDEYKESDPYTVEVNLDSDFHNRRIDSTLEMIAGALKETQGSLKILDLGSGQGHITARIKKAYPQCEVSALDYSLSAIEYAVDHFPTIDFVVGDVYKLPFARNYFDIVVCNNLWEHVPDPLFLLDNISRIIKPSGFLIISTPSRYRLENLGRILMGKPVTFMSSYHVTEYSVGQVIEQLSYKGFRITQLLCNPPSAASLKAKIGKMIFSLYIFLTKSHHLLGPTVFYLAKRMDRND